MQEVSIFVDVQNIYYTTKQAYNKYFNYRQFWQQATHNRQVVHALAYAIDSADDKRKSFKSMLEHIGFTVKLKPYIQRKDGSSKGDWDVGITLDVVEYTPISDVIVIATGDGDFDLLVSKMIRDYNVSVEIYGVQQLTAQSLRDVASKFIPIDQELLML
jgi:uncharacterized LabA/DUF88 family protein